MGKFTAGTGAGKTQPAKHLDVGRELEVGGQRTGTDAGQDDVF